MLLPPDLMLTMANNRHRELLAEADRRRLFARTRRQRRNLASCEVSAAVPAP